MTATDTPPATLDVLIPERPRIHGPLTRRTLRRTLVLFACLWVTGLTPVVLDASPWLQAAGISLLIPPGGFLYTSDPLLVLLALALVPWVAFRAQYRGDIVVPVAYWVLSAVGAALRSGTGTWDWARWSVPSALLLLIIGFKTGRRIVFVRDGQRRLARNAVLADVVARQPGLEDRTVIELSERQLATLSGFLNIGLQPDDQWDGLEWGNQYSMEAMRYQLAWLQYGVGLANHSATPAFTGYLAQAQRSYLTRMTDKRVWTYWRHENLFGNLERNPDPVRRENIMYSGYWAAALGSYASTTGDMSLAEPGALALREDASTVFEYDHRRIIDALLHNIDTTPWGLFPCEPSLNFPVCNTLALLGIQAWDRRVGTNHMERLLPHFRRALDEEFMTADGEIIPIISNRFGYSWRMLGGVMAVAGTAFFIRPLAPDLTARLWEIVKAEELAKGIPDDFGWMANDFGTGKRSPVIALAFLSAMAQELGDTDVHVRLLERLDEACDGRIEEGVHWYHDASTIANVMAGLGRLGRADGWYDLFARGNPAAWDEGPRLSEAPYPDVLVARAVTDGTALELVLRRGAPAGRHTLGLERLRPHGRYRLQATSAPEELIEVGQNGRSHVDVTVGDRTEILLTPVS